MLEVVSKTPGKEYDEKMKLYAEMGALYYSIYNPDYWQRDKHDPFEVYRLVNRAYVRQPGNPVWMPEMGLGIGRQQGTHEGLTREWLYWYDKQGNRFPTPNNVIEQARQRATQAEEQAEQERQRADQVQQQFQDLIAKLRERGIDPNNL